MLRTNSIPSLYQYIMLIVSAAVFTSFKISVSLHRLATPSCSKSYSSAEQGSLHSMGMKLSIHFVGICYFSCKNTSGRFMPFGLCSSSIDIKMTQSNCWINVVCISKNTQSLLASAILIVWIPWRFNLSEKPFNSKKFIWLLLAAVIFLSAQEFQLPMPPIRSSARTVHYGTWCKHRVIYTIQLLAVC